MYNHNHSFVIFSFQPNVKYSTSYGSRLRVCLASRLSTFWSFTVHCPELKNLKVTSPSSLPASSSLGQARGACIDWQAVDQSPAVVGRVPGVETSLSGAVLPRTKSVPCIRPWSATHPVTHSHSLLHWDPCLKSKTQSVCFTFWFWKLKAVDPFWSIIAAVHEGEGIVGPTLDQ